MPHSQVPRPTSVPLSPQTQQTNMSARVYVLAKLLHIVMRVKGAGVRGGWGGGYEAGMGEEGVRGGGGGGGRHHATVRARP